MTHTQTADRYVVHELLATQDKVTPCEPPEIRHTSENVGQDILCSEDGFWKGFTSGQGNMGSVTVDAAPIEHRGRSLLVQCARLSPLPGDTHSSS